VRGLRRKGLLPKGRLALLLVGILAIGATACASTETSGGSAAPVPTTTSSAAVASRTPSSKPPTTVQESTTRTKSPTTPAETEETSETKDSTKKGKPTSSAPAPASPGTADTAAVTCPAGTVSVNDASSLEDALKSAKPGTVIQLADGTYSGHFVGTGSGEQDSPIWLCGGKGAVINGDSIKKGYAVHLKDAEFWRLVGFSIENAQKGVIVDNGTGIMIQGLTVSEIGDEAIHLRAGTTYSVVRDNDVSGTGMRNEKYGEGIYVGSASSNWCTYSACGPDRSNNNAIVDNRIHGTSAESIDIKEGTQDGLIQGNTFDGTGGLVGADSWVDVKGNGWQIIGNIGANSPVDGFQVHSVVDGWGTRNVFQGNTAEVNGDGFGIHLAPVQDNTVSCDNKATGAASGMTNTTCT